MAEMAVTVAASNGTLRTCPGVSPTAPGGRRAAVLGRWRPLAPAAPANLRLSSPAVRVPRATSPAAVEDGSNTDIVPIPKVIIDQDLDPDATIVEITLGDRLGDLLDTMNALKNLGLNVVKASVCLDSTGKHIKLAITKVSTGRKIDDPELLEAVRLTIINNMIEYHPESSSQLAMGATFGPEAPREEVLPKLCQRLASSKCLTYEPKTSQFSMEIHETILFVYIYRENELAHNDVQNCETHISLLSPS